MKHYSYRVGGKRKPPFIWEIFEYPVQKEAVVVALVSSQSLAQEMCMAIDGKRAMTQLLDAFGIATLDDIPA